MNLLDLGISIDLHTMCITAYILRHSITAYSLKHFIVSEVDITDDFLLSGHLRFQEGVQMSKQG